MHPLLIFWTVSFVLFVCLIKANSFYTWKGLFRRGGWGWLLIFAIAPLVAVAMIVVHFWASRMEKTHQK